MNRFLALFLLAAFPGMPVFGQGTSKIETLKRIKTVEQAESLLKKLDPNNGSIGRFNCVIDSVEYKEITQNYKIGDVFFGKKLTYKVLQKEKEVIYRCQYIYLDGKTYSKEKADSVRNDIISKHHSGTSFEKLAALYPSVHTKKGGDSGWFHKEKMGAGFSQAVADHSRGQIFTFDDPEKKGYYVVLKSHSEMQADSWVYITLR